MENWYLFKANYYLIKMNNQNQNVKIPYTVYMVARSKDMVTEELYNTIGKNKVSIREIHLISKIDHFADGLIKQIVDENMPRGNYSYQLKSIESGEKLLNYLRTLK